MKMFLKMFMIFLLVFLIATPCLGTLSLSAHNPRRVFRNSYQWSGHPSKDYATQWAQDVEDYAKFGVPLGTGDVFYVDSEVDTEGDGTSWDAAKDTLAEGWALCAQNNGDVILVSARHAESLSTASALVMGVAGVRLRGMGSGTFRPTLTVSGVALIPVEIVASNISIDNFIFRATVSGVPYAIVAASGADGFSITNCRFNSVSLAAQHAVGGKAGEFIEAVSILEGVDDGYLGYNKFYLSPSIDSAASAAIIFSTVSNLVLEGNEIYGFCSAASIKNTKICQNLILRGNTAINGAMLGDGLLQDEPCLELVDSTSGFVVDNRFVSDVRDAMGIRVGDDMIFMNNWISNSDGEEYTGILEGEYNTSTASHVESGQTD